MCKEELRNGMCRQEVRQRVYGKVCRHEITVPESTGVVLYWQ